MVSIASVQLSCTAIATVLVLADLKRHHPSVMPGFAGAELPLIRELVRPSASFALLMLSEAIRLQAVVLLVSRNLGGAAVAVFVSSRTLCNLVRQITGTMRNAVWPHVTAIEAQGHYASIRQFHRVWVVGSTGLSLMIAAALWFEGSNVIEVWTRGRLTPDTALLRLLLVQVVLQAPWLASGLITLASSRHGRQSQAYFWSSVIAVGLTTALIPYQGLLAVPIGSIVGEGLVCYHFVTHNTCMVIGEPYWRFAVQQWAFVASASGLALLFAWAAHKSAIGPPPVRWAEVGLAAAAVTCLAAWFIGFRKGDREQAKAWLRLAGQRA
jgi:O-antigen/teichoic acid export membrane protein